MVMVIGVLMRAAHVFAARRKAAMTVLRFESVCNCESATRFIVSPPGPSAIGALTRALPSGSSCVTGTPWLSADGIVNGASSRVAARQVAAPFVICTIKLLTLLPTGLLD